MKNRPLLLGIIIGAVLLIAGLISIAALAVSWLVTSPVARDRSQPIAGGLTTGGWDVVRDSTGTVARGYLLAFQDGTLISNNLTYERVVPYVAISEDAIELAVTGVHPTYLAFSVQISQEGETVVLSTPVEALPEPWFLYVERVVDDSSRGDLQGELVGKWRIYGADIFDVANLIRDGDSGTVEFSRGGKARHELDRPPEVSSGLDFPEAESYTFLNDTLIIRAASGEIWGFRAHSLGDLIVLEKDDRVPWILVRLND